MRVLTIALLLSMSGVTACATVTPPVRAERLGPEECEIIHLASVHYDRLRPFTTPAGLYDAIDRPVGSLAACPDLAARLSKDGFQVSRAVIQPDRLHARVSIDCGTTDLVRDGPAAPWRVDDEATSIHGCYNLP